MLEKNKHIYTWKINNNNLFLTENYVKFEEKFLIFHQKKNNLFFCFIQKKMEGDANIFGVFRVKYHDFTSKNHIFPILGGCAKFLVYFLPPPPPPPPPLNFKKEIK
jgi:hypothetical protein